MMASFHLMRRQLPARLRCLNCGQVGERGSCPLTEVTHVLRPAESACARPMRFARLLAEKSDSFRAVVTSGAETAVLKSCVLSRRDRDRCGRASRTAPCFRERHGSHASLAFRMGNLCAVCW